MKWWLLLICWLAFIAPCSVSRRICRVLGNNARAQFLLADFEDGDLCNGSGDGKQRLVFSDDANAGFLLLPGGDVKGGIVEEKLTGYKKNEDPKVSIHAPLRLTGNETVSR